MLLGSLLYYSALSRSQRTQYGSQTMDAFINIIPIPFSYFVWHQIPEFKMVPELMSQKKNVSQVKKSRICL
jgi:hypothetical protein